MTIERTKEDIIIKISSKISTESIQNFLNFIAYQEATFLSVAKQSEIDALANEVNTNWWNNNKNKLIR